MERIKIISISHKTFMPGLEDILKKSRDKEFHYEFVPVIAFNEKKKGNQEINDQQPIYLPKIFSLYENDTPIESLIRYIGDIKKEDLLIAKRAFAKLQTFASQCSERVIADLSCQVILDAIKANDYDHLVCFIVRPASDKMLGRLGYLYLDLEKITICFISYEPDDMITTVMSAKTGKLIFDINRLMASNFNDTVTTPHPGSSEDSLVQTYFFKPRPISSINEFLPIRIDIFCQGLLEPDIEKKSIIVYNILNSSEESPAFPITKREPSPYVRIPFGIQALIKSWDDPTRQKDYIISKINEVGIST